MTSVLLLYQGLGHAARKKTAGEHAGPCPACGGDDRFLIFEGQGNDGLGRFYCRQCERGGDAIQFLRDFQGLSYRQACRELGREPEPADGTGRAGGTGPAAAPKPAPRPNRWEPRANPEPCPAWQGNAGKLVAWAEKRLAACPACLDWLREARGITAETARRQRLGWIPSNLFRERTAWGLPQELKENGQPRKLFIPEGLVIPVFGEAGQVLRVKVRRPRPGPREPRYLPIPSEPKNTAPLMIHTAAGAGGPWAVVESELDAILLSQEADGLVNVAALGSASYRPDAELFPVLEAAPFVLVCLDFDDAGNKAAWTWWAEHLPGERCRVWPVPEGKDPSDAWAMGWDLCGWIAGGLPPALAPRTAAAPQAPSAEVQTGAPDEGLPAPDTGGQGSPTEEDEAEPAALARLWRALADCERGSVPHVLAGDSGIGIDCGPCTVFHSRVEPCAKHATCPARAEALDILFSEEGGAIVGWIEQRGGRA